MKSNNPRMRSQLVDHSPGLLFQRTLILILAMMSGSFPIGFPFLVEMKINEKRRAVKSCVTVEARVSGQGKWPHKTHLGAVFPLENVAESAKNGNGVG